MMEKKRVLSKVIAVFITIIVLVGLLLTGPAQAFVLSLNSDKTSVSKGENIIFTTSVDINSNERLPISKLVLELDGPENVICEFGVNGTILDVSKCKGLKVKRVDINSSLGYGYSYGYYNGSGYDFGYGYGYESGKLSYEITLATENYTTGKYSTLLKTFIDNKVFEKQGGDISISIPSVFVLNVISPEEKYYGVDKILLKISTGPKVRKIEYINFKDINPVWKELCRDCDSYGFDKEKTEQFKEGANYISVRATNYSGTVKTKDVKFYVDTQKPSIRKTEPAGNSFITGDEFLIRYTEENLKSITLFYGSDKITKTNKECPAGKLKECGFIVNVSKYNGQKIEYWFKVEDFVNSEYSEKVQVFVDTISPVLTIYSPVNTEYNKGMVRFNISVSENVTLEYKRVNDRKPEWQKLCDNCKEYGYDKKKQKYFSEGKNGLLIRAVDRAGNSKAEQVSFNVKP